MSESKLCCPDCDDGDGRCAFPYYGVAPHICGYKMGVAFGGSQELPESEWPENFQLDIETGDYTGFPRAGVYTHCLKCGRGESKQERGDE